jgi:hypothetical protein
MTHTQLNEKTFLNTFDSHVFHPVHLVSWFLIRMRSVDLCQLGNDRATHPASLTASMLPQPARWSPSPDISPQPYIRRPLPVLQPCLSVRQMSAYPHLCTSEVITDVWVCSIARPKLPDTFGRETTLGIAARPGETACACSKNCRLAGCECSWRNEED